MSLESATRFLKAASHDQSLREKFSTVRSPEEFLQVSEQLGYHFSTAEMYKIVTESSEGSFVRRSTGVWRWLRSTQWM